MAKVSYEEIKGDDTIKVGLDSKDQNYKITTDSKVDITLQIETKPSDYTTSRFYSKDGNNLVITTIHDANSDIKIPKKIITTTILDYYTHLSKYEDTFKIQMGNGTPKDLAGVEFYKTVSGKTTISGTANFYLGGNKAENYTIKAGNNTVRDFKGNDKYKLQIFGGSDKESVIYDYAGNDKYTLLGTHYTKVDSVNYGGNTKATINDYLGNDTYTVSGDSTLNANDYAGNDKYNIDNVTKDTTIKDYAGNDKYSVNNSKVTIVDRKGKESYNLNYLKADSSVTDYDGNDKYTVTNADGTNAKLVSFVDQLGNDNYNLSGSKYVEITDDDGNDKYNLKFSDYITIVDSVGMNKTGGKETYTLSNVINSTIIDGKGDDTYKLNLSDTINLNDDDGLDKYTITNSNGITIDDESKDTKDIYTIKNSSKAVITSNSGDDKYNISNDTSDVQITDKEGNEVYNIKDTAILKITDTIGNDKYNLTNVDNFHMYISGNQTDEGALDYSIKDNGGSDTYTIKNSSLINIYDTNESDTYNITSSSVNITDSGSSKDTYIVNKLDNTVTISDNGGSDTLNLVKAKAGNIIFMASDYFLGNTRTQDNSLYIYDKANKGYAVIKNFFTTAEKESGNYFELTANGAGIIETINVGKTKVSIDASKLNELKQYCAEWLEYNGHSDLASVFKSGDTESIDKLVNVFSGNDKEGFSTSIPV